MLGQSIRTRIESVLPAGLSAWAEAANRWRLRLKLSVTDFGERRAFWKRFIAAAWADPDRIPSDNDFDSLAKGAPAHKGRIILVGAGPGDPSC